MEKEFKKSVHRVSHKVGFGLIVLLAGLVLLGLNFGFVPPIFKTIIFSWPTILIVIGLFHLFGRHVFNGIMILSVGVFFIIPKVMLVYPEYFQGVNPDFTHTYWPILLIIGGVLMILAGIFRKFSSYGSCSHHHHYEYCYDNTKYSRKKGYSDINSNPNSFSMKNVFKNSEHIVLEPEFRGGTLETVFGGISLDLRKTTLPVGDTFLDVKTVFGGVTIYVPFDWYVEKNIESVFGGFQDLRIKCESPDGTRRLRIKGSCVFGGGEIKN